MQTTFSQQNNIGMIRVKAKVMPCVSLLGTGVGICDVSWNKLCFTFQVHVICISTSCGNNDGPKPTLFTW